MSSPQLPVPSVPVDGSLRVEVGEASARGRSVGWARLVRFGFTDWQAAALCAGGLGFTGWPNERTS